MNIVIVGIGYVGLVTGTCFTEMGNRVICVDSNHEKIENLQKGEIPIYEPGLEEMVKRNMLSGDLCFSTQLAQSLVKAQIVFIAVGTPMGENGSADLQYVLAVADEIGTFMNKNLIIVNKSTVPVGTADKVRQTIQKAIQRRIDQGDEKAGNLKFDVVSNPEFLKEGSAVADFMKPDRVVIGADSERSRKVMKTLYEPFMKKGNRILSMDIRSAEMTKYAANAMLATRISFINEISRLCDKVGANVNKVRQGIGSDSRIGSAFLFPGCGYGGSCFPKDIRALIKTMVDNQVEPILLQAVENVNTEQKKVVWKRVVQRFGNDLSGKSFAIWGLAFKPNTDDMREAPATITVEELLNRGACVRVFDPKAMNQAKNQYFRHLDNNRIYYAFDKYDALDDCEALLLLTEWSCFRSPDFDEIRSRLQSPIIIDGRNQFESYDLNQNGFEYYAIGIPGKLNIS
ncbi:MAG: UDP-glucose/GDP-mannose dehydrogenase family protein [Planctomycetia bacterium]|nr:UDP-glucose/GDP-mannose dehydrogenase family protein [Planctomycetia bacterium]